MKRLAITLASLAWSVGCVGPQSKPAGDPIKAVAADIVVRVRPIIVGHASDATVSVKMADLAKAHAHTGIRWDVLPIDRIDNPAWRNAVITDATGRATELGNDMQASAKGYVDRSGELAVFFCDRVESGGMAVGGAAYYPPSHGIFISSVSCGNVVVHETGHAFSLTHTDPISGGDVACRIMSYSCRLSDDCRGQTFNASEISTMRSAAMTSRRPVCSISGATARLKAIAPKTATGDLEVCPIR